MVRQKIIYKRGHTRDTMQVRSSQSNMKVVLAFVVLVCVVQARPQQRGGASARDATILKYEADNDGTGSYRFAYETSDSQTREEQGSLQNAGTDNEFLKVIGSFSFLAPDGVIYTVKYIADENGFQPEGDHIPGRTPKLGLPPAALASLVGAG